MARRALLQDTLRQTQTARLSELDSGVMVLFGMQPGRHFPILEMRLRQSAQTGADLYIVGDDPTRLDRYARKIFHIPRRDYRAFLILLGMLRASQVPHSDPDARLFFESELKQVYRGAYSPERMLQLVKATVHNPCTFITDGDANSLPSLQAFIMHARLQPEKCRLLVMHRGTNPLGALQNDQGVNHGISSRPVTIDAPLLHSYDTLLYYQIPVLFEQEHGAVVHIGPDDPGQLIRRGLHIPVPSLLETGGNTHTYAGDTVRVDPVLHKRTETGPHTLRLIKKILTGSPEHV
jgi:hypothetical protein